MPKPTPQQALAVCMGQQGSIQDADYRQIFSMNRLEASPQLAELVMRGVLIRQGERRDARYPAGPAWETWWSAAREGFPSRGEECWQLSTHFIEAAQGRTIEMGVLMRNPAIAESLARYVRR